MARIDNPGEATVKVITNAFTNIGIESLLGGKKAYINFDAVALKSDIVRMLPKENIVLEIPESVKLDLSVVKRLRQLHEEGYRFTLDDVQTIEDLEVLLPILDSIKLDINALDRDKFDELMKYFQVHNKALLAVKIENYNDFELCKSLGFRRFQGYFFAKPTTITEAELPADKQHLISIMNSIMEDAENKVIEKNISRDISICYKLLKFVNSAGLSQGKELSSVGDAVNMLGRKQLYRWISVLLYSTTEEGNKQPNALLNSAVFRGRFMEIIGEFTHHKNPSELFVLGAFSFLEALLQRKLSWLLQDMLVPEAIREALLESKGEYWPYLELAENMHSEKFNIKNIGLAGLTIGQINQAQLVATAYCESIT
ncbi:MAG: HDOD domain-containing protein [Candidatus Heimdallarchaeota archaeon]|nr:HDOD domain-containing protein [Candidatus Heimdallarchaeota archaeon]